MTIQSFPLLTTTMQGKSGTLLPFETYCISKPSFSSSETVRTKNISINQYRSTTFQWMADSEIKVYIIHTIKEISLHLEFLSLLKGYKEDGELIEILNSQGPAGVEPI